jgi:hypothetical protein
MRTDTNGKIERKQWLFMPSSEISSVIRSLTSRISIVGCALLTLTSIARAGDISKNPSVLLAGERLFLANVEGGNSDELLNEYIRKDETFDNWKVLFALRRVHTTNGVNEVVARWKAYLTQVNSPGLKVHEEEGSSPNDRRFMLAIRPPGDAYLETDELRFIPAPGGNGVIYYQAAVRVVRADESEVTQGLAKQAAFAEALNSLSVTPVEKMPDQTTQPASPAVTPSPKQPLHQP